MDNNQNQNHQQMQIELPADQATGVYSNLAIITHSPSEFVLDFAAMMPGMNKMQVRSRVVMTPEHAKRLLGALQDNVVKYEREFGKIELHNQAPRTIAPFEMGNKGEA